MSEPQPTNQYAGRPSVCRNCGALVGAGQAACAVCGAAVVAPREESPRAAARTGRPARAYDVETVRFARAVLARPATFTFVFLALNVFVFVLMSRSGGTESEPVLRAFGAKYNSLINQRQWWRLVTPVFIHIGWLHLFVNMYSLFMLGPYVERLYGSARFVVFWIATGVAGVAASYFASSVGGKPGVLGSFIFRGGDGPSAGASGALFGLVGVLFVFGIKYRHELPEGFKRAFGFGMLPTILINLFIGYTIPFIDNAAHLGGLAAGMLFALVVNYKRPGERGSVALTWHALQVVALALVVVSFGEVARHFATNAARAPQVSRAEAEQDRIRDSFIAAINSGRSAVHAALDGADAKAPEAALKKIDAARAFDADSAQLLADLRALVVRAHDFTALDARERASTRGQMLARRLEADFQVWDKRSNDWVKANGDRFGVELDDENQQDQAPQGERDSTSAPNAPAR
ncbi:MAG: rhomboid family intramembrane serine protease [Acidobacteria bacterium]|nr:rhomboid family intramembrane serine protease [Acidobacteriota bacterium]